MAGHIGQEKRSKMFLAKKNLERLKKKPTDELKRKTDLRFGVRPLSSQTAHAIFHCRSSSSDPNCCILFFPISLANHNPPKPKPPPITSSPPSSSSLGLHCTLAPALRFPAVTRLRLPAILRLGSQPLPPPSRFQFLNVEDKK